MRLVFTARHIDLAVFVVPGRYLMAPPQLAADTPIGDVVHPLVVGVDPVFRDKFHFTGLHHVYGFLGNAFARRVLVADFVHGDKPLVGQHGFYDLAGAGAARHHQFVFLHFNQQTQCIQVSDDGFARHKAIHATVFFRCQLIHRHIQVQDTDHGQLVTLTHCIVIRIMRGCDFDHAGAESLVHIIIGNHRDCAVTQRQMHLLTDQVFVAIVFRVDHDGHVTQHGFRSRRGDHQSLGSLAINQLWAVHKRITDMP